MQFQYEKLVDREIEIGDYLRKDFSVKQICKKTGLSKKLLVAHIHNMLKKLKAKDMTALVSVLKIMDASIYPDKLLE